jgi:hypothetical protein
MQVYMLRKHLNIYALTMQFVYRTNTSEGSCMGFGAHGTILRIYLINRKLNINIHIYIHPSVHVYHIT